MKFDSISLKISGLLAFLLVLQVTPDLRFHYDFQYFAQIIGNLSKLSTYKDWHGIAAPRVFPELLLYFSFAEIFDGYWKVTFLTSVSLVLLQCVLVYFLAKLVFNNHYIATMAAIILVCLYVYYGEEYTSFNRVGWHIGTLINLMMALWLMLKQSQNKNLLMMMAILFICVAGTLSDFLFAPLMLSSALALLVYQWLYKQNNVRDISFWYLLIVISIIFGFIAYYKVHPNPLYNPVNASDLSLRILLQQPQILINALLVTLQTYFSSFIVLLSLMSCLCVYALNRNDKDVMYWYGGIVIFVIVGSLANEFILALGAKSIDRYRVMSINGMMILFAINLAYVAWHISKIRIFIFIFPLILIVSNANGRGNYPFDDRFEQVMDLSSCLSRVVADNDLQAGLSDFRLSQVLSIYSNNRLKLLPLSGNKIKHINQFYFNDWLEQRYDYVLAYATRIEQHFERKKMTYSLDRILVEEHLGKPDTLHQCEDIVLMVYKDKLVRKGSYFERK